MAYQTRGFLLTLLFALLACDPKPADPSWTSDTPAADVTFAEREEICEEQLDRASELESTECNGNPVPLAVSQNECTGVIFVLLENCGLSVGDFEDCVSELLIDECALFQEPPPPGCAPLVACLYVPE